MARANWSIVYVRYYRVKGNAVTTHTIEYRYISVIYAEKDERLVENTL